MIGSIAEAADALRRGSTFILAGHIHPDGDCLGSVLALGLGLESIGKKAYWVAEMPLAPMYQFIPGADRFIPAIPPDLGHAEIVALDCGDRSRLAIAGDVRVAVNIDHHASNDSFAEVNLVDPNAASTGEIVFELLDRLGITLTSEIALALYVAIATDTGFFRFSNTRACTLTAAGKLVALGVDPGRVAEIVHERKRFGTLKLLGHSLTRMGRTPPDGRIAWMEVRHESLARYGADIEETEGFVNYTRQVEGVDIGILFKEGENGEIRVSLRSSAPWDVSRLAALFGGGGHPRAAGCTLRGPLHQARRRFLAAARRWLSEAESQKG